MVESHPSQHLIKWPIQINIRNPNGQKEKQVKPLYCCCCVAAVVWFVEIKETKRKNIHRHQIIQKKNLKNDCVLECWQNAPF